jgi:hypothetical protein
VGSRGGWKIDFGYPLGESVPIEEEYLLKEERSIHLLAWDKNSAPDFFSC